MNILDFFKPRRTNNTKIKKVAVIGSGVMGAGIAGQIANAGTHVLLLDIVPKDAGDDRSKLAKGAIERMAKTSPAPLMHAAAAGLITPGNLEDDLDQLKSCDWIIEVVLENLDIKHALYQKIDAVRAKGSIVSSNTSTIPLEKLIEGQSPTFVRDFMITHFFNPPRYMQLLELITGPHTRKDAITDITAFCDIKLGKGVVPCHDTPGFIVNRILTYFMEMSVNTAIDHNISIETADALLSKPVGIPKTGVFGLIDLIGVDLMPHLAKSLTASLDANDPYVTNHRDLDIMSGMIAAGYTGRKGKGGFYKLDENRNKLTLNLQAPFDEATSYQPTIKPVLESLSASKSGLRALIDHPDAGGKYAWHVLSHTLCYTASLVPTIADDIAAVDAAIRMGCNWQYGPFELIDLIGPKYLADRLRAEGRPVPTLLANLGDGRFYKDMAGKPHFFGTDGKYHPIARPQGVLLLSDIKKTSAPLLQNPSAALWNIGEGVLCLEFTSKMNALDEHIFNAIQESCDLIEDSKGHHRALVIYNEAALFCAGANLNTMLAAAKAENWDGIEDFILTGQAAMTRLKYAPFPVVAAPAGLALGGGCEILLAADHTQAHAELTCGLVEPLVGLIPGWGGCTHSLSNLYAADTAQFAQNIASIFENIAFGKKSNSAQNAKDMGILKATDAITMNRDRLLHDARTAAIRLSRKYIAPTPTSLPLGGTAAKKALTDLAQNWANDGKLAPHDILICDALASVLTGGDTAHPTQLEQPSILDLERDYFIALIKNEASQARITHMLEKGKPLRN